MNASTLRQPIRRRIVLLLSTLLAGLLIAVVFYLIASTFIGQIDRRIYDYHSMAETLALRLHDCLSAVMIPRGSVMSPNGISVIDSRVFAAEAIRSYDEILVLEDDIRALHREFEDSAVPDRAVVRLERSIAALRSMRERYGPDNSGFAVALSTSRPYLDTVAKQLYRYHGAERASLREYRLRVVVLSEIIGVVLSLSLFAGVGFAMRGNLRSVDTLLEHDARQGEALRESEEKFAAAFRGSPDVMVINRTRDGMIVDVNPAFERFFGYQLDELLGRTAPELGLIADPLARQPFVERLLRDGAIEEMPWRCRIRNGEVRDALQSAYLVDIGGEQHHVAILHDMTESNKAQAALQASEEALRKLNRELELRVAQRTAQLQESNHDLESFSYSVSHDLRAPLRHVVSYLDLLKRSLTRGENDMAMQRMDAIAKAARKMGDLIDDLLSFARIGRQGLKLNVVDTNAIVRDVQEILKPETQGRSIEWHIGALPVLMADHGLLKLVFMNLISNAVKFTHGRTPARIEVGCMNGDNDSADYVVFVKDNGAGFDMRYSDKLFGVFQRLHSRVEFEGTGIGLANCRRIIDRHYGRIWGEGIVDGGATFFFTVPKKANWGEE